MFGSSNRESLNTPRLWHSRAGGGAVHGIISGSRRSHPVPRNVGLPKCMSLWSILYRLSFLCCAGRKGVVVGASPNSNFRENIHCVGQFLQLSLRRHFYQAECSATEPEQ